MKYRDLEDRVIDIFNSTKTFMRGEDQFTVITAAKPSTSAGECKTDVYVLFEDSSHNQYEFKISVKTRSSNEFQENKVTPEKAEAYFGPTWVQIISSATQSLKETFESRPLIYVSGKHPTKPNSITLGWKLEIASKSRSLSVKAPLTDQEIRDYVFAGTNQSSSKKNAYVNNIVINDSGVANSILITELGEINNVYDILNQLILIDRMAIPPIYLIFTANNYRTDVESADGPRNLAVYIKWETRNNKLVPIFVYDDPLYKTGERDIKPLLINALKTIGKSHPWQFNAYTDLDNPSILLP